MEPLKKMSLVDGGMEFIPGVLKKIELSHEAFVANEASDITLEIGSIAAAYDLIALAVEKGKGSRLGIFRSEDAEKLAGKLEDLGIAHEKDIVGGTFVMRDVDGQHHLFVPISGGWLHAWKVPATALYKVYNK